MLNQNGDFVQLPPLPRHPHRPSKTPANVMMRVVFACLLSHPERRPMLCWSELLAAVQRAARAAARFLAAKGASLGSLAGKAGLRGTAAA